MKKKVILLSLLIVVIAVCFIPVTQQKTVLVKGTFFNIFPLLNNPVKWKEWRTDLRAIPAADSNKIVIKKDTSSFQIKYDDVELNVQTSDGSFDINDHSDSRTTDYNFLVMPDKNLNKTLITVTQKGNLVKYLMGKLSADPFSATHLTDLKHFVETDSLLYGCNIFKNRVPESNLIVIDRRVLAKNKFTEAAQMLATLQQYIKTHGVKQMQPLIAQFLTKGPDSAQIKVGIFIDKEVKSESGVTFTRMPKGGPLYSAKFNGKFDERMKVYGGLHQYFIDHRYQSAILPFESYLDNKLPASNTDKVNIKVNFSTYF